MREGFAQASPRQLAMRAGNPIGDSSIATTVRLRNTVR